MWNDVIKIILGAIIGGFTTFFVQKKLKERNSLAYEILSKMSLIDVKDEVKKKIKIEYEEFPANNIYSFKIRLVNDGNVAIKNQPILFEFPKDCHILETKIDTKPRFEFGPITLDEKYEKGELDFHLERYIIDMVNPKDEIEFRFLTINNSNDAVKIHCKGENLRFHQIDRKNKSTAIKCYNFCRRCFVRSCRYDSVDGNFSASIDFSYYRFNLVCCNNNYIRLYGLLY